MPPPADAVPAPVVAALGLDQRTPEPVAPGRISVVWRAWRDGDPVALRRTPWFRTPGEVGYEVEVVRRLADAGAPVAAPVAGPVDHDGHAWVAFAWAPGRHPERPADDPETYGRLLAELHTFTATVEAGQRPRWCAVADFLRHPRLDPALTLEAMLDDLPATWGDPGAWLRRQAVEVDERLRARPLAELPSGVVHGDFGPHQVLVDGPRVTVLDWDFGHHDLLVADVAIATSLARPTVDRAVAFLRGYRDGGGRLDVDPDLLGDFRRAFHLDKLANQLASWKLLDIPADRAIDVALERLQREQWWAPMLARALTDLDRPARARRAVASDLDVAHELADRAAVVARHWFEAGVTTEAKPDDSPVTEADRAVERLLIAGLAELRPGDAVLGEEFGSSGDAHRTWILDPIDGTRAFARGDDDWRIQLALREGDEMTVAVVDVPALGLRWWATAGGGAFEVDTGDPAAEPRPLSVSTTDDLRGCRVATYPRRVADRLPDEVELVQRRGWLALRPLVHGEIDAFLVDCCQIWDHAPWVLLVREAGGAFTDHLGGRSPDERGGLYSNGHVHDALAAACDPPVPLAPS